MPEHIEAILFDMGGTLRRSTKREFFEKVQISKQILELLGSEADPADFTHLLTTRASAYQKWAMQELIELNEIDLWTQWMLPDFPVEKISKIAVRLNKIWRDADKTWQILPNAQEAVLTLYRGGYRLGLVSNTTSSVEVPGLLDEWRLAGYFDTVILSCQVGKRKPGPDILLEATERMQVRAEQCAYIGNLPQRDVAAARKAGFSSTVILRDLKRPFETPVEPSLLPDHFIDDLKELLEIFPSRLSHKKPATNSHLYDASLSSMWGIKKFSTFGDFFLAAPRLGFAGIELNHQVSPGMLAGVDLNCCRFTSIHEPCPAVIAANVLKKQDLLISSPDEERRREGVNSIKRSIDLAGELGSGTVVVHCGQLQGDWTIEQEMRSLFESGQAGLQEFQELKNRFVDLRASQVGPYLEAVKKSLVELLDYVGHFNVRLGIENRYHFFDIPGLDEMGDFLKLADQDRLGFIYDVGHAQTLDQLGFYPHEEWLKRYANRIIGSHLHDVIGISDHRAPGLGEVDFRKVAAYLPKEAFRTLEIMSFNTPEQIKAGMKILVDTGCVNIIQ
jgi:FMN phosphatase YigB (HAD superfamily)/sugar phosphate isomerase/epimerase